MSKRIHFVDINNFITPFKKEFIYILGLIWADGSLYKGNISLEIQSSDFFNFQKIFKLTGDWREYHRERFLKKTNKYYKQSSFHCCNKKLFDFLIENDYDKKSFISPSKILELIPKKLQHHFIRGYIDGDGSFSYYKNNASYQCKFNITSTVDQDWSFIENIFNDIELYSVHINKYNRKNSKSSIIGISNKWDIIKLGNYLYEDSFNLRLERKYDKFLEIKNSDVQKCNPKWTVEETEFLKENYHSKGIDYCVEKLNKTKSSLYGRIHLIKNNKI